MKTVRCILTSGLFLFFFFLSRVSLAQNVVRVNSHGSEIILTVWPGKTNPDLTVLLVPGWGGGPSDVLGIAQYISKRGIPAVVLSPRGWHQSEGEATFANALEDIDVALSWISSSVKSSSLGLNSKKIVLGGHSWGGGMSLAYAARDTTIKCVFSVAGTDHGQFIRMYNSDENYKKMVDEILLSTAFPNGPIKFNTELTMEELSKNQNIYGLLENAGKLADRRILIFGGWEDVNVTIDDTLLPFYRKLRSKGAEDLTFIVYHADHSFRSVREKLHEDLFEWLHNF